MCERACARPRVRACVCVCVTLHEDVHRGGARPAAGLHGADVGPLVRHVHVLDLDGELVLVQGDQADPRVHRPLVLPRVQDAGAVQPGCVCDDVPLGTTERWRRVEGGGGGRAGVEGKKHGKT